MKKTVETGYLKIKLSSWPVDGYLDLDLYYDGKYVTGYCLSPDTVDDLVIKLLKVKQAALKNEY
jgi:hypothetical protein